MLRAVVFSSPSELGVVNDLLRDKGLTLRASTVVDATLIAAPSSTKNASGERDPEMHHAKKGNQWHFGMKAHIGAPCRCPGAAGAPSRPGGPAQGVADLQPSLYAAYMVKR